MKSLIKEGYYKMTTINDLALTAISRFLEQQIDSKSEKLQKQLMKAQEDGNHAVITECQTQIDEIKKSLNVYIGWIWL